VRERDEAVRQAREFNLARLERLRDEKKVKEEEEWKKMKKKE